MNQNAQTLQGNAGSSVVNLDPVTGSGVAASGKFVDRDGERFYAINNVDGLAPFFVSLISDSDHWLFVSSTGGLTAGRVSPDTAFFPYITVDKIHDSVLDTGPKTIVKATTTEGEYLWEPFNPEHKGRYRIKRNVYKNTLGNKLCFEEINQDLNLQFAYTWKSSDKHGFVRHCEVTNLGAEAVSVNLVDGVQNVLPAGTPRFTQTNSSNLVDAYKWNEVDQNTGLALFTLYSAITDRAEPCEALKANTAYYAGLDNAKVLISSDQLELFKSGQAIETETHKRGIRGSYFVQTQFDLAANASQDWLFVYNVEQTQSEAVALRKLLGNKEALVAEIHADIERGSDSLARIMAGSDGFQRTEEESVSEHHYANVLYNNLRGGIFNTQYDVTKEDVLTSIQNFNSAVFARNAAFLSGLPEKLDYKQLMEAVRAHGDTQLERLCLEYLPITFGRRHGDPSRPWNQFVIKLKDDSGKPYLSYQGNWRDIFQNWEALTFSYPEFIESVVAKFVNASTVDGYNPYRITKEGIDWEVEDPEDPWSYIGYWGDHQIIYLLKLLELSRNFHPSKLGSLLHQKTFSYANVPYRIKSFDKLVLDAKDTVEFDDVVADTVEQKISEIGADGKLILTREGEVYQVNLLEKLLVPLLSKLGNLVVDGGIWLNTQRPEWNDANNALVGQGLSMVTLYYMRRYVRFMQELLADQSGRFELSKEVGEWLEGTKDSLAKLRPMLAKELLSKEARFESMKELGEISSTYRQTVYGQDGFSGSVAQPIKSVVELLEHSLAAIDHTIEMNERHDGLYHAYNLLGFEDKAADVDTLYPMLEGQVAVLSSGAIEPENAVRIVEALFDSKIYREDQHTFMLYPDRELPSFLEKNIIAPGALDGIALVEKMLAADDQRILELDAEGHYRFNASLTNSNELVAQFDALIAEYGHIAEDAIEPLKEVYEEVFNHKAFTGRSGGMFGFEGLGSIYWHMVSKLLLAVQENFFSAAKKGASQETLDRLGELYYEVRKGIGFNKTPSEYGAFPCDPYSHTPKHAGAQQPGMTGQVKEEVLTRFGELGIAVQGGLASFSPILLRQQEFLQSERAFRFLDVNEDWQEITVPANAIGFTWCQVPIVYQLDDDASESIVLHTASGDKQIDGLTLASEHSSAIFERNGAIQQITVTFNSSTLFTGPSA